LERLQHYPIIVVEGPDGAGKTTLAERLKGTLDAKVIHLTYRFGAQMHRYHTAAIELALRYAETQPVILDRWWPSEIVYANAFRGGSKWPLGPRMFDRVAQKHGVTYVLALPVDRYTYLEHFKKLKGEREEMYDTMDNVYSEYLDLYERYEHRDDFFRYTMEDWDSVAKYAESVADRAMQHFGRLADYAKDINQRDVAGNLVDPEVLLVGEQSNPKGRRRVWPFFEYANSSLWMADALQKAGVDEVDLAWANAFKVDGGDNVDLIKAIVERTGCKVVPLGAAALRLVEKKAGIKCYLALRHPQHTKRFEPDNISGYHKLKAFIEGHIG
jgi:thymidylate kinase